MSEPLPSRTGVWIVGALGSVSACVVAGVEALRHGRIGRTGMVTALPEFEPLGLADPSDFVFGGWDVRGGSLVREAEEFGAANGVLTPEILQAAREGLEAATARLRPGVTLGGGAGVRRVAPLAADKDSLPLRGIVEALRADLREFREKNALESIVVVHLASAEPWFEVPKEFGYLEMFLGLLEENRRDRFPASVLYAVAAMEEGCAYVNFTSCLGSNSPALDELARRRGVPHMGRDGKTGETLVKTALAPMFAMRNLRVLSWEGHNLLGNRDGRVLDVPEHNRAKVADKDAVLRGILQDDGVQSRVRIDYVPALGDWKTAWDHIVFEGFLGTKMKMQFVWEGCDSALAAPLVIDLIRLAEFAKRRGEVGAMAHLASFFKAPYGFPEHALHLQVEALLDYAERHRLAAKRLRVAKT